MNKKPLVSVIVANYNCEAYIRKSISSALNQTIKNIEVILVDDKSTDGSLEIASELAAEDGRLKVISLKNNSGPSAARNKAFEVAQGEWIAIMDSDDWMHPHRLKKLLNSAKEKHADIVVDDLYVFSDSEEFTPHCYLGDAYDSPHWVSPMEFIRSNSFSINNGPGYGVLKPLIRREIIQKYDIQYDESLKNSEDYDLVLKLMLAGANYLIIPYLGYYYRKHHASISYRLDVDMLANMIEADKKTKSLIPADNTGLFAAANFRHQSIKMMLSFQKTIEALKNRQYLIAVLEVVRNPSSVAYFSVPINDNFKKLQVTIKKALSHVPESTKPAI
jgi:succinoglycan biosynthesis protein ExoO